MCTRILHIGPWRTSVITRATHRRLRIEKKRSGQKGRHVLSALTINVIIPLVYSKFA